jgi:hypothetical protein
VSYSQPLSRYSQYDRNWHPLYPLRKVKEITFCQSKYSRPGHGSNRFFLECGHIAWAKYSQGHPSHKRCRDCWLEQQKKGAQ